MIRFVVREVVRVNSRVVVLRLDAGRPFSFKPGQFVQVSIERGGRIARKAYSIASCPRGSGCIELCVRVVDGGFASNYLANLKPGQALDVEGPFGAFTLQGEVNNDLVFLAAGAGIAALKPMIESVFREGTAFGVWLFLGARTEADILYRAEFESLASSKKNFHFVPVLSQSENPDYEHGYVQDAFKRVIRPGNQDIYICGFSMMVGDARVVCRELGYPDKKVHFENYG